MVNWYLCPQVHSSKLIAGAVPVGPRQGEVLDNVAVPGAAARPPSPGLSFTLGHACYTGRMAVGGGHLCMFRFLPPLQKTPTCPFSSLKTVELKSDQPDLDPSCLRLAV